MIDSIAQQPSKSTERAETSGRDFLEMSEGVLLALPREQHIFNFRLPHKCLTLEINLELIEKLGINNYVKIQI